MEKALRRLTYSLFFLLFFILAPLLTAYSLGYRYDFNTGNIEKNGAFYVKSYPKGATIYVDKNKKKSKTPTQVLNIKPGVHLLEVAKEEYVSWQKELSVKSGETTFAEDIVLFLENREKTSLGAGSENFLINKAHDKYAIIDNDLNLIITDVEQAKTFDIYQLEENYNLLDWSADNQKILMSQGNAYYQFDINQKSLTAIDITGLQKIIFENGSDTLIYLKDNKLYRHYTKAALSGREDELLDIKEYINDFDVYNNWLIIQYTFDKNNFVAQLDKYDLEVKQEIANVNLGKLDALLADDHDIIFSLGSRLYIKNEARDLISIPITIAKLHDNKILITNGHEIILFDYKSHWQELIDRSSNIVSDVFWHPNGSYFVSEIESITHLTELDGRDKRNSIELLSSPRKKMYLFDKKGERLYILSPEENYYLTIQ